MNGRNTRQKKAIRDAFENTGRPLSAVEVLHIASQSVEGLGIATVYRNIKTLAEERWLSQVDLPGEPPRYELSGKPHHHHFYCRTCGCVFDVDGCVNDYKKSAPKGFQVADHSLVLYGRCLSCGRSA